MGVYKLLALDMDGTVLNAESQLSEGNKLWIKRAVDAGIHVCFATGRGIEGVLPFIEELQLQTPVVTVNGSEVWKTPSELLTRHTLIPEAVVRLRELARHYDTWYWGYGVSAVHNKTNWIEDALQEQWLKFGFYMEDDLIIREIREEVESWDEFEISNSHPHNLEVNPKGIHKAKGLLEVCQLLGIHMSEVVAMGDSLNDLHMIKQAGLGVAMGNAQDVVKQAADVITLNNTEDGVAQIIQERFFADD